MKCQAIAYQSMSVAVLMLMRVLSKIIGFMRGGYLNAKLHYKQSVYIPGARLSPIDSLNGVPIFNLNFDALIPFKITSQQFFYQPEMIFQLTRSDIDGLLDKATIGGLYSVYGF
ncbi:two-partner secretion system accessory protein [Proteus mirabilis]|uniref:Two-partner secretion system accessory protein n=1 Tax=Proteus mirabilis TaxID=584 RepID=A0A2X2C299_PROMI|nr:two-partner secretion system accessory protein [Proteus mirabilis]